MRYELEGTLIVIKDTQQVSDRFKKREFVVRIDEDSQFPQTIPCQFTQDRCDNLDSYSTGDKVKVDFYLKGREWTSPQGEVKHFLSVDAWSISKSGAAVPSSAPSEGNIPPPPAPVNFDSDDSGQADDDLPF